MNTPSTESSTPAVASAGLSARAARTWDLINKSGIVMVFIILFAVLSFTVPDFLSSRNIQGLLLSVTLIGSISVTMMFVLALGEVDLSVASIVAFAGVVASTLITATHSVMLGVAAGVLAGGAVGLVNGVLVARYKINSLIVTLAMMEVVRGLAYITSSGDAVMFGRTLLRSWRRLVPRHFVSDLEQHRRLRAVRFSAEEDRVRQERAGCRRQ